MTRLAWTAAFCLAVLASLLPAQADGHFEAPRLFFDADEYLSARAMGDLDEDGDMDIVFGTRPDGYEVWENLGGLQFQKLAPRHVSFLSNWDWRELRLRDVNGDGHLDIVAAKGDPNAAPGWTVFRGRGDLTFRQEQTLTMPSSGRKLSFGDFNGDQQTDWVGIAYNGSTHELQWWYASTSSTFAGSPTLDSGGLVYAMAALDLDGDGLDDAVYVDSTGLQLFTAYTVGGAPVAGQPIPIAGAFATTASRLFRADMDGDGDLDLLYVQRHATTFDLGFTTFFQSGAGNYIQGAYHTLPPLATPYFTDNLVVTDWDQDGDQDLIGKVSSFLELVENRGGDLGFQLSGEVFSNRAGSQVEPRDLDGDGRVDYIDRDAVLFSDGTFPRLFTDAEEAEFAGFGKPFDLEGDGDLDRVAQSGLLYANDGTGRFTALGSAFPVLASPFRWGTSLGAADYNGDGTVDFLVDYVEQQFLMDIVHHVSLIRGERSGGFFDAGPAAGPGEVIRQGLDSVHTVDLDGDGDQDLVMASAFWMNDGDGAFAKVTPGLGANVSTSGDVDLDGDIDLLTLTVNGGTGHTTIEVHFNDGGLSFTPVTVLVAPFASPGPYPQLLDLDDDGDLDVAFIANRASELHLFENTGGAFVAAAMYTSHAGEDDFLVGSVGVSDTDGDGLSDLLVHRTGWSPTQTTFAEIYRRQPGSILYDPPVAFSTRPGTLYSVADVDGDGDLDWYGDFVVRNRTHAPASGGGRVRQFGAGTPGTGGAVPVLGASGPVRVGESASVRVRRVVGGSVGLFTVGLSESNLPGSPWNHTTSYAFPWAFLRIVAIPGSAGTPGAGTLDLPFTVPPEVTGLRVYHQLFAADPAAPAGITATNGLEIWFGD